MQLELKTAVGIQGGHVALLVVLGPVQQTLFLDADHSEALGKQLQEKAAEARLAKHGIILPGNGAAAPPDPARPSFLSSIGGCGDCCSGTCLSPCP